MKLIDKYLLRTFLVPLTYILVAFTLVFVIQDLFNNMSDFVEAKTAFPLVVKYYIYLTPSMLAYIIPVSLMLAVLYSLSSLTKNNELTAMRASGVSLYRLMMPFMITGLLASIAVAVSNETVGPWSAYWTDQFLRSEKHKDEFDVYMANNLAYKNVAEHREWFIENFDSRSYDMNNITIKQFRPDDTIQQQLKAKKGQWLDGEWWFTDVTRQEYRENGRPKGGAVELNIGQKHKSIAMTDFNETPASFIQVMKDAREHPEQFSSKELRDYIARHKGFSEKTVAMATTDLYGRMAMPWICLIVTLLGVPFGSQTGRKGAFIGVLLTLTLFFGYYFLVLLFQALGKGQYLPPLIAAWVPNIFFGILGGILVYRMR